MKLIEVHNEQAKLTKWGKFIFFLVRIHILSGVQIGSEYFPRNRIHYVK